MVYLRNKIRYELIPLLESEYNPEILNSLDRLSRILRQEDDYLATETKKHFMACLIRIDATSVVFSKSLLAQLHPALVNRVFRKAIFMVKKDLKRISLGHLDDIIDFCFNTTTGVSLDLPGKIRVYKDRTTIRVKKEDAPLRDVGKKEKQFRRRTQKKQDR